MFVCGNIKMCIRETENHQAHLGYPTAKRPPVPLGANFGRGSHFGMIRYYFTLEVVAAPEVSLVEPWPPPTGFH